MLDLFLQLIDRLTSLAERGARADERLFVDYVQPTFAAFERIHLDYLQILKGLRVNLLDMLSTEAPTIIVDESARTKSRSPGLLVPDAYSAYDAPAEYRNTMETLLATIRAGYSEALVARLRSTLKAVEQQRSQLEPIRMQLRRRADVVWAAKLPQRVRRFFTTTLEYADLSLLPEERSNRRMSPVGTRTGSVTAATVMVVAVNLLLEDILENDWDPKRSADLWMGILAELDFMQSRLREGWSHICRDYEYLQLSLKLRVKVTDSH